MSVCNIFKNFKGRLLSISSGKRKSANYRSCTRYENVRNTMNSKKCYYGISLAIWFVRCFFFTFWKRTRVSPAHRRVEDAYVVRGEERTREEGRRRLCGFNDFFSSHFDNASSAPLWRSQQPSRTEKTAELPRRPRDSMVGHAELRQKPCLVFGFFCSRESFRCARRRS